MQQYQATILVVEDDPQLREAYADTLELSDYNCLQASNGREGLQVLSEHAVDMVVSDVNMPEMDGIEFLKNCRKQYPHIPVLLVTAYGSISRSVDAIRAGAVDYLVKPFAAEVLLETIGDFLGRSLAKTSKEEPIAEDPQSQRMLQLARRVAQSDATVMITGESGTGKEVLARYIHTHSSRSEGPFVAINCAAIPENMLEAMLFGYEKGAFTGAYQSSSGKFEQANGGTLLLDEISEMDIGLQAKLLRVLQEQEVERLGGRKTIELDVRVLATSNRDMQAAVHAGTFREDLYYRLNVFPLRWQSLRDRPADVLPLAEHLLASHAAKMGRCVVTLSDAARAHLAKHTWPGNIRELDNVMQRALILQPGSVIEAEDILLTPEAGQDFGCSPAINDADYHQPVAHSEFATSAPDLGSAVQNHEFDVILQCLQQHDFNRQQTARTLGVSERTLRYKLSKMRDLGMQVDRERAALG